MCHIIQDNELNELKITNEKMETQKTQEEEAVLWVTNRSLGGHKAMPGSKQREKKVS